MRFFAREAVALALTSAFFIGPSCGKKTESAASGACDITTSAAPVTHFCIDYMELKKTALEDAQKQCTSTVGTALWIVGGGCATEGRLTGTCTKEAASGGSVVIYFYPDYNDTSAAAGCQGTFAGTWHPN